MATFRNILIAYIAHGLPLFAKAYILKDDYTSNSYVDFFSKFQFDTFNDPTHGYVDYVNQDSAWTNGLIGNWGNIYLGVDHTNVASGRGRKSVRLTSKTAYNINSLFVVDVAHMVSSNISIVLLFRC